MRKRNLFDMLGNAEEEPMDILTDKCPEMYDAQMERLFAASERKYRMKKREIERNRTERDNNITISGETVSGAERIRRPAWLAPACSAASLILVAGLLIGSTTLFRRHSGGGGDVVTPAVTVTTVRTTGTTTALTGVSGSAVTTTVTTAVTVSADEGGTSDNKTSAGTVTTAANAAAGGSSSGAEAASPSGASAGSGAVNSGLSVDAALGERAEDFFVRSQELSNLLTFRVMETDDSDYISFDVDPSVEFYTRDLSLGSATYCNTHTAYFARVTDSRFGSTADIISYYNSLYYSDGGKDSYYGCTLVPDESGLGPVLTNGQQYSVAYIDHNGKLYQNTFYPNGRHPVMHLYEDSPVIIKDRTDTSFTAIIPYYVYDISSGFGGCELMSFAIDPACGDWRIVKEEFDDFSYYEECRQKLSV